ARLAALHAVAEEAGATPNQVVIAWLLAHDVVPVVGVSSLAQLEETLAARDLKLDEPAVRRLDGVTGL
ncbi:MAG TPA: aldo/keto reductase, partial [Vulgatibacteraceae bacterium]|nr:aldo/keto reductase [Vulgatibacteraceae bacterium]